MDETGIMLGHLHSQKVVVPANALLHEIPAATTRESATAIECICADDTVLNPMIIFAAKSNRASWYDKDVGKGWLFGCSEIGYRDEDLSYLWMTNIFHLSTVEKAPGRPRVLLTDGHNSHFSPKFMEF